jgi:adenylyl-sulfate kinase
MTKFTPGVFWLYGLSGAGKTTLSRHAARALSATGIPCLILDGDDFRAGLCRDLGFSSSERSENIRRAAEIAEIACRQRLVVLAAFITPQVFMREMARRIVVSAPFYELFISCDFDTCALRDVKGLYQKAAAGNVPNFTGWNAEFEVPENADAIIDSATRNLEESGKTLLEFVMQKLKVSVVQAVGE